MSTVEKLQEQYELAQEYGFEFIWIKLPINEAEEWLNANGRRTDAKVPVPATAL